MSQYGGITIGPIVETLSMVAKPAGLWGASYMFSYLAEQLCLELLKGECHSMTTAPEDLVEPVVRIGENGLQIEYSEEDRVGDGTSVMKKEGVGLLHDRIIWKINNEKTPAENLKQIKKLIEKAKANTIEAILGEQESVDSDAWSYFEQYLKVRGICVEVEEDANPLLTIMDYLDVVELKTAAQAKENCNYVLTYLDNNRIKNVAYFPKPDDFSLAEKTAKGDCRIKDLETICRAGRKGFKSERYFAIVHADGDNVGKTIAGMKDQSQIRAFSRMCIKAALTANDIVKRYGGYMIYAGGDDLLFLAPVAGKEKNSNLISLLQELSLNFKKLVEQEKELPKAEIAPTLSFGVSIQYYKYPLYEAFMEGRYRLFGVAKKQKEKDAVALRVQKHSGQSLELLLKTVSVSVYADLLSEFFGEEVKDEVMSSVYTHFRVYEESLKIAFERENVLHLEALMDNLFDNVGQEVSKEYRKKTLKLAKAFYRDVAYKTPEEKTKNFLAFLKLVQFYFEKGEE